MEPARRRRRNGKGAARASYVRRRVRAQRGGAPGPPASGAGRRGGARRWTGGRACDGRAVTTAGRLSPPPPPPRHGRACHGPPCEGGVPRPRTGGRPGQAPGMTAVTLRRRRTARFGGGMAARAGAPAAPLAEAVPGVPPPDVTTRNAPGARGRHGGRSSHGDARRRNHAGRAPREGRRRTAQTRPPAAAPGKPYQTMSSGGWPAPSL